MSVDRAKRLRHLTDFLRTIQRPGRTLETLGENDNLVTTGLIDSLAIVQIVLYLESTYGINFSERGLDADRLVSMTSILDLIEEADA